jgi:hypothetical protein
MHRWLRRLRKPDAVSDDEVAARMLALALAFIRGTAAEGDHFGWDSVEASRLDDLCEVFLRTNPPAKVRHSMMMAMGAYLGELMVRNGGGRWTYDVQLRAAVVQMPNELNAYPHNKVAKRLKRGAEHHLFQFYWYGLTRDLPPRSHIREVG